MQPIKGTSKPTTRACSSGPTVMISSKMSADDRLTPGARQRATDSLDTHPGVGLHGYAQHFRDGAPLPTVRTRARRSVGVAWPVVARAPIPSGVDRHRVAGGRCDEHHCRSVWADMTHDCPIWGTWRCGHDWPRSADVGYLRRRLTKPTSRKHEQEHVRRPIGPLRRVYASRRVSACRGGAAAAVATGRQMPTSAGCRPRALRKLAWRGALGRRACVRPGTHPADSRRGVGGIRLRLLAGGAQATHLPHPAAAYVDRTTRDALIRSRSYCLPQSPVGPSGGGGSGRGSCGGSRRAAEVGPARMGSATTPGVRRRSPPVGPRSCA